MIFEDGELIGSSPICSKLIILQRIFVPSCQEMFDVKQ